jgi:Multicopper oxidase
MLYVASGQWHTCSFKQMKKLTRGHYVSYRLRLVSISCEPAYTFSIDSHSLTIIEVDGINVKPLEVDSLQIFAGKLKLDRMTFSMLTRQIRSTLLRCCKGFFI